MVAQVLFRLSETTVFEPPREKSLRKCRLDNFRGNTSPETSATYYGNIIHDRHQRQGC